MRRAAQFPARSMRDCAQSRWPRIGEVANVHSGHPRASWPVELGEVLWQLKRAQFENLIPKSGSRFDRGTECFA